MMIDQIPTDQPLTAKLLAELSGYGVSRINHCVRQLEIKPRVRFGRSRVFDIDDALRIMRHADFVEVCKYSLGGTFNGR